VKRRRSPGQVLFVAVLVIGGIWIGLAFVREREAERFERRRDRELPDVHLRGVDAETFARHPKVFFRGENQPRSWDDIHYRVYLNRDQERIIALRCRIDADEAARLYDLETGAYNPHAPAPPAHWPWDRGDDSPFAVPAWWDPEGPQSLAMLSPAGDDEQGRRAWVGTFVNYDPETRLLHIWHWLRLDWEPPGTGPEPVLDLVVQALSRRLIANRHPVLGDGWMHAPDLDAVAMIGDELAPCRTVDVCLLPGEERHRYLVALHGDLDREEARRLIGERPLAELPADAPPPRERWAFALPVGEGMRPPLWFAPGPGPRWASWRVHPGTGEVDRGRWAAWDDEAAILYVWDWADPAPHPGSVVEGW